MNDHLPDVLDRFGDELRAGIARELAGPRRRPRRTHRPVLVALVLTSAVAVAVTAAVVVTGRIGTRGPGPAWGRHVLRAAEIALPRPAPHTILYVSVTQTMTAGARGHSSLLVPALEAEGWFEQGPPWRSLVREQVPGRPPSWQAGSRTYDPAAGRVYVAPAFPSAHPRFTLRRRASGGFALSIATARGPVRETVTAAQARALRTRADGILWEGFVDAAGRYVLTAAVVPARREAGATEPTSTSLSFPAQLHRLLQSGHARVTGRVTVGGRPAIEILITGVPGYVRRVYDVDPTTYAPIELDDVGVGSDDVTRIVFHADRLLSGARAARRLRLPAPASVRVDPDLAGFDDHLPPLVLW